jgi:steroid delta-isomerase-like uncharacterized protein
MSNIMPKDLVLKLIEEVWNKGNLEIVDELIAPQYVIQNDPGDAYEFKTLDLSAFKQRVKFTRDAFPDVQFSIKDVLSDDSKVAISWFMSGTQKGDLPNLPAAGKKINVSGITIYYVVESKITGHWQVFDRLSVLAQLGISIGIKQKN